MIHRLLLSAVLLLVSSRMALGQAKASKKRTPTVLPAAVLTFTERGEAVKGQGKIVADVLTALLGMSGDMVLVEREELQKVLDELHLGGSGVVAKGQAGRVGQLTGAKLLITGSVFQAGKENYIVVKIIGAETSQILTTGINGKSDFAKLCKKLATGIVKKVKKSGPKIVPEAVPPKKILENVKKTLGNRRMPSAVLSFKEKEIGKEVKSSTAAAEFLRIYRGLGGKVADQGSDAARLADLVIEGKGSSQATAKIGKFRSARAVLKIRVLNRKKEVVVADRQTCVGVGATAEQASKAAFQEAANLLAARLLPKLGK